MSVEEAFLEAIRAEPDNDTHRLVYADWLEEQGNSARAEFIRVQVELARMAREDPRRPSLQAHERHHRRRGDSRPGGRPLPGPPDSAGPDAQRHRRRGAQALAAAPRLARLKELDLSWNHVQVAGAQALAASPHLAGLAVLVSPGTASARRGPGPWQPRLTWPTCAN